MKPISPTDVVQLKGKLVPDAVISVFNDLIALNFLEGYATVKQEDVVERLCAIGFSRSEIFTNKWLDVEDIYRGYGWDVQYDKPGYNESYPAVFIFKGIKAR